MRLNRILLAAVIALPLTLPALAVDTGGPGGGPSLDDARAQVKAAHWADAVDTLRYVLDASPSNPDALNLMGYSLRKLGNMDRALGFYLKALKISPNHRGANEYLGELYVETGQIAKARERLQVLEGICGTSCEEYEDLKDAIEKHG